MNEREEHELLKSWRPLLRSMASRMTTWDRVDELSQEGWIAVWKAAQTCTDASWCMTFARNRMHDVAYRKWRKIRETQVDAGHTFDDGVTRDYLMAAEASRPSLWIDLTGVEMAYHHGELATALDALTPKEREYVELRFWHGLNKTERIAHFGYEPTGVWQRARQKLAAELAHLRDEPNTPQTPRPATAAHGT